MDLCSSLFGKRESHEKAIRENVFPGYFFFYKRFIFKIFLEFS